MPAEQNKTRIRRALAAFNDANLDGYLSLYTNEAVIHDIGIPPGRENIRHHYEGFQQAFPDAQILPQDMVADGEQVACRYTLNATHRGPFMGLPPTGRAVSIQGSTILRFKDGACAERWAMADFLGLLEQLGALPGPEEATRTNGHEHPDPATLARTLYRHFNEDRFEAALDLADDAIEVVLVPFGQTFRGKDGFLAFMQNFKTAFPGLTIDVQNQVVSGEQVVNEITAHGTHEGPFQTPAGTIAPTRRAVTFTACEVWQTHGGKVACLHNYQDAAGVMQQLGLTA